MKQKAKAIKKNNFQEHFIKANESHMEASLASSLIWSVFLLNLSVLVTTILVYLLNSTNSVIYIGSYLLMCLLTFAIGITAAKSKLGFGNGIIVSLLTWLLMGWIYFVGQEYLNFYHWKYDIVKNISVKDINQHPDASAFYFNDGKILLDKHSTNYYITGAEESAGSVTSYLVPFVPNNWKENDSVHVFLFGEENNQFEYIVNIEYSDFYEDLKHAYNAGLVLRVPDGTDLYTEKIKDAVKDQRLNVAKHPFVLKWLEDPEKYVKEFFINCLAILIYFNLGWILFAILRRVYFAYRRSRKNYKLEVD